MPLHPWNELRSIAEQLVDDMLRHGQPLGLLLASPITARTTQPDTGFMAGDAVAMGTAIVPMLRRGDMVGIYNAQCVAVLAEDTDEQGAVGLAERIQRTLALPDKTSGKRSTAKVVIGVAILPRHGRTLAALIASAEAALADARSGASSITVGKPVDSASFPAPVNTAAAKSTAEAWEQENVLATRRLESLQRAVTAVDQGQGSGVSIEAHADACPVCRDASRDVYLIKFVPLLPLAGCTNPEGCRCIYGIGTHKPNEQGSVWTRLGRRFGRG
jgi:GGDEF domain-containing protein